MILLIDHFDSFAYNLARYFVQLGQTIEVVRSDNVSALSIQKLEPDAIVLSPGPCSPKESKQSVAIVQQFYKSIPMLGICLGHQIIATALGGKVSRADIVHHGKTSQVKHNGTGLFEQIPSPFSACRYHSLLVEQQSLPEELEETAWTNDGTLMAFAHTALPVYGLQFHPESILTENGYRLLANFLRQASLGGSLPADFPVNDFALSATPSMPQLSSRFTKSPIPY